MDMMEGSGEDEDESLISLVSASYASTEVTNGIVLGLTVSVMVIYVVTYIVVAVLERRRLPQGSLHMPVGDVLDTDHYYYVVTVATGLCCRSGLNPPGRVQITLRGSAANSRPLVIKNLDCSGVNMVLKRGGIDYFLLPVPSSLGEVQKVDIDLYSPQYDSISWYVKFIRVTDVRYGTHTDFPFDRWLSTCDHLRMGVQQSKMSACRLFGERFLSIFLDLNVWTSMWTRSSELGVFRRSVRVSFWMMTLACLMAANLLVCFIPVIAKKQSGLNLLDQVSLIKEALIFGVAANVVVLMVQYLFELLLRRVRTPSDHHLAIRGRNIWKKKPLPSSMYPVMEDSSYCDTDTSCDSPTRPLLNTGDDYKRGHKLSNGKSCGKNGGKKSKSTKNSKQWKEDKGTESWMPDVNSLPSVLEVENEDFVDGLADGSGYFADDEFGNQNKEVSSKVLRMGTDMTKTDCDFCSHSSNNYNLNANKVVSEIDNKKTFTDVMKHILWNEVDGIVAKYIMMQENASDEKLKPSKDRTTKVGNEEFASYLVSLILEDAKNAVISGEHGCMEKNQHEVLKKLQMNFKETPDFMDHLSQGGLQDDLKVHSRSSEGQLGGQVCRKTTDQSLSVTSSCPEVQSPKPSKSDIDNYGPVATRLSESITAIAYRNSFTSLQRNATDKLASQSRDRIASFTNLVQETNLTDQNLMVPSSSVSAEQLTGIPQRTDKMNVKTLLEFISPNRAERLTEKSMKYIAKASLSSLVSAESLQKLRDTATDFNQRSMQAFTFEVVNNLYSIVRGKLEDLIEAHLDSQSTADNSRPEQIAEFLAASDEEIKTSVLPLLEDYIQSLVTDQARSIEDVDVDLVMMAFSGQYVDTIITNAVLQTHVGLLKAKKSIEVLNAEQKKATDSNINNNTVDAINSALVQLQQTQESQKIVELLCQCMLNSYKNRKGCTIDHPEHINEAMKNAFRRSASAYEAFERVLSEAVSYLKLLSEHCDMKRVQENSSLMAKLSETFLVSGLDIETHSVLTEELSSKLLDTALGHACVIVAESLVVPYLHPNSPPTSQGNVQTTGLSPVTPILSQPDTPGPETESDVWKTPTTGSPKLEDDTLTGVHVQRSGSVGRDDLRRSLSDRKKTPKSRRSLGDKLNEKRSPLKNKRHDMTEEHDTSSTYSPNMFPGQSPIRSSTPRLDGDQLEKWSPMQDVDEVDFGAYRPPSDGTNRYTPIDTQQVWPSSKRPRGVFSDSASSQTNTLSIPLMPKDCHSMLSYDDNISQVGNAGLMYIPCKSSIETGENTLAEREKLWQLDLERDIHGESTKCLPSFVMHILQLFIVMVTVAALSLCILFGLRLPNSSAVAWLVALVAGIIQHAFVWETLKVTAVALYYVTCYDVDI